MGKYQEEEFQIKVTRVTGLAGSHHGGPTERSLRKSKHKLRKQEILKPYFIQKKQHSGGTWRNLKSH